MSDRKRLEKSADPAPFLQLVEVHSRRAGQDVLPVLALLGVPPDLRYLRDGLLRTRECLPEFEAELTICLKSRPEIEVDFEMLGSLLDALIKTVDSTDWTPTPGQIQIMARPSAGDTHPLRGYCLDTLSHWGNLFYMLEPAARAMPAEYLASFESLMAEFSAYVLAAQATASPECYSSFCEQWFRDGLLPRKRELLPDDKLRSRLNGASRAMRRLTLLDNRPVFEALADLRVSDVLHERLWAACRRKGWSKPHQRLLAQIALLLEDVRPSWSRSDSSSGASGGGNAAGNRKGTARRGLQDGYVRIAGIDVIASVSESAEGMMLEVFTEAPPFPTEGDDQYWSPVPDRLFGQAIEALELADDEDAGASSTLVVQSKWAREHLRRHHFAHPLLRNGLSDADVEGIAGMLREMATGVRETDLAFPLVLASLVTGRPLRFLVSLPLEPAGGGQLAFLPDESVWRFPCPPPAWWDEPRAAVERPTADEICLPDYAGFGDLLAQLGAPPRIYPVQKISRLRRQTLERLLAEATGDPAVTLHACSRYLFDRLLSVSGGDLAIATMLTGTVHSHSPSVRHYAHYPQQMVRRCYRQALAPLCKALGRRVPANDDNADGALVGGGVGACRVPTPDSVRALFSHLASGIRSNDARLAHNAYTAYTLAAMAVGFGLRPLTSPRFDDLDAEAWVITFGEKLRSDYHRRVAVMPPALREHLIRYSDYRRRLSLLGAVTEEAAAFLYAHETGAFVPFRPIHFEGVRGDRFPLELYALRRFFRTELTARGVAGEDVDAAMGHWFDGVSPHDALSAYPMRRLRALAEGPASGLLEACGFAPLKGPR